MEGLSLTSANFALHAVGGISMLPMVAWFQKQALQDGICYKSFWELMLCGKVTALPTRAVLYGLRFGTTQ